MHKKARHQSANLQNSEGMPRWQQRRHSDRKQCSADQSFEATTELRSLDHVQYGNDDFSGFVLAARYA